MPRPRRTPGCGGRQGGPDRRKVAARRSRASTSRPSLRPARPGQGRGPGTRSRSGTRAEAADHDQGLGMSAAAGRLGSCRRPSGRWRATSSCASWTPVPTRAALDRATARIRAVARHLTRFEAQSALSRANRYPRAGTMSRRARRGRRGAQRAHHETDGLFDPRVLDALLAWGYDRTFADVVGGPAVTRPRCPACRPGPVPCAAPAPTGPGSPWCSPVASTAPDGAGHLGGTPIDLGGIGKGLAVRSAAAELAGAPEPPCSWTPAVTSGSVGRGRTATAGRSAWRTRSATAARTRPRARPRGERPGGRDLLRAAAALARGRGRPCTIWSTPARACRAVGAWPRSPCVHPDPAWAEVWSKTLFLTGASRWPHRPRSAAWPPPG